MMCSIVFLFESITIAYSVKFSSFSCRSSSILALTRPLIFATPFASSVAVRAAIEACVLVQHSCGGGWEGRGGGGG